MSVLERIRKAVYDYEKETFSMPEVVHMSDLTWMAVTNEAFKNVFVACILPNVNKVYGMTIKQDNRLPFGLVIVGGVVCDVTEDERAVDK